MDADEQEKLRKKKRSTAKGKFHRIYRRLNESIDDDEEIVVLRDILKDLECAYAELEKKHDDYIEHLSEDERIENLNDDMDEMYKELCRAKSSIAKFSEQQKKIKATVKQNDTSKSIRVKKLDAPVFSGGVRSYPSFRRDFEAHMVTTYGDDPFALKRCLSGEALLTVAGVDDDYDEMFRRLDLKYGRPEKLTDAVLMEIKKLKKVADGDFTKFIEMVEVVERCWLDLKRMKLEHEMNTTTMISQIEKLLPSVQKREWALRKQKEASTKHDNSFPLFLDFLLEEKYAMEYMDASLRECSTAQNKHKIYSTLADIESESDGHGGEGFFDSLKIQMEENKHMLQQVVEGLAQVAQVVTSTKDIKPTVPAYRRKKCWYHEIDSHDIGSCVSFAQLDNQTKINLLKKNGGCFSCLKPGHISNKCLNRKPCEITNEFQHKCGRMHHPSLHGAHAEGMSFHNALHMINDKQESEAVLLMISKVLCKDVSITTLWDPGANMTLITHRMARKLGLKGKEVTLSVTKVGNVTELINSKEYVVPLTDLNGSLWQIRAYGMDEVTAEVGCIDTSRIVKFFPGITENDIKRPTGKVDLLVGTDCCILLPHRIQQVGNLQLMKNQFGYCLRGNHEFLTVTGGVSHSVIQIHFTSGKINDLNDARILTSKQINESLESFFDIESLGTHCVPRCGSCKCGKCPVGSSNYTIKEERELMMIQQGLEYDASRKRWVSKYPWTRDPKCLPNNFSVAKARLNATEKRLKRSGRDYSKAYHDQIIDMLQRHVARKLSACEMNNYEGPVHYIHHHEVLKPGSKSTPIRIVFNSSAPFMGHVLNDYWAKGPKILNDMLGILIRFRQNYIAIAGDISKMYNSVGISVVDQHTHRFLWRDLDSQREPDHYALQTVTFGDKPSGSIATVALRKTAQIGRILYPEAADLIERNSYVDDLLHSVDNTYTAQKIASETEAILREGGFTIKQWIISRTERKDINMNLSVLDTDEERVLGMCWAPKSDTFKFKVKINFSSKRKKICLEEDINKKTFHSKVPCELTRRMVLRQVASIFDPLGLITPFVLAAKNLMRNMCIADKLNEHQNSEKSIWDAVMSVEFRERWFKFFFELFDIEEIEFPRCLKPQHAVGKPTLIVYSDGSNLAYGACAYLRWNIGSEQFQSRLIMSKNRIAPVKQLSIPRLELCGAVLAARLRDKLQKELDFEFERVVHIVDSMIVRAQIQKESYGFGMFVATRIAEIQSKTEPGEWWWVASDQNPADMTTRITSLNQLGTQSTWQNGPEYLKYPIEMWPISQECDIQCSQLPDRIGTVLSVDVEKTNDSKRMNLDVINLENFNSFDKLIKVTSIILTVCQHKSFKSVMKLITSDQLQNAELQWVKYVQTELPHNCQDRYKRLGCEINNKGVFVVGQRMADWLRNTWNTTEFILLPPNSKFARLLIKTLHNKDHLGIESTLAKLRSQYWIPGARRMIKLIKNKCVLCRKIEKQKHSQRMGQLPIERLKPSPAFYYCALDLFGPITIKDTVKKRTHSKAYGVLFNCMTSRAVHIDLADGYDTDSFLIVLRRFVSLRGFPRKIRSDFGSQLVSAKSELTGKSSNWNWSSIEAFGVHKGMEWEFTKSADAPWENGCSEALIKSTKRCLMCAIGSNILTFSELQTILFEVANCLNERPIGTSTTDPNEGSYLCPNDLILGRATTRVPVVQSCGNTDLRTRWKFIQQVTDSFWKKWQRDYFPTLIIRQKWHISKRNLSVGDIVLVQDTKSVRGQWKLAEIIEAEPGRDGKVRDVTIRYKNQGPGAKYSGVQDTIVRRSVHRLVVILPIEEQGEALIHS